MSDRAVHIVVDHVVKSFTRGDQKLPVLNDISLEIEQGEFLTIFGPNGSGKSTLLNVITGIESIDSGEVRVNSGDEQPKVGYVFQDYRGNLMPWLTVAQNIAFPLKVRKVPRTERRRRVESLMRRFGFDLDLDARTYALSGGQAQFTSILRALIIEPEILIMDEPFSALDYQTNRSLYDKILFIWQQTRVTTILVSHDLDEALYLGERTVFLTKRPASVAAILDNRIPGPKTLDQMGSDAFAGLKRQALSIFSREAVGKS